MNVNDIVGSRLQKAEQDFNNAFSVLEKIKTSAENAEKESQKEEAKADLKRHEFEMKRNQMSKKRTFYAKRAAKIAAFIASLDD